MSMRDSGEVMGTTFMLRKDTRTLDNDYNRLMNEWIVRDVHTRGYFEYTVTCQ